MNKSTSSKPTANVEQEDKEKEPLADQAKQAVTHVAGQVKEQVTHQLDARKETAVEKVGTVADALRETSDKLKDIGPLGDVAGRAADGIQRVQSFFEDRQVGDIVRDVERFARREPALFLGGALAIGLAAGRFLKSSSHSSAASGGEPGRYAYGGDDYLPDDDLEEYVESNRYGAMGGMSGMGRPSTSYPQRQRDPMRTTLPLGTPVTPPSASSQSSQSSSSSTSSTQSPTASPVNTSSPASASGSPSSTGIPRNGSTGRL